MRNDSPLLSVAILADSQHHLLRQTLESIACQEAQNFEVLLFDSRHPSVWPPLKTPFRLEMRQIEGKSAGAAMNQALALCRGTYIQFLRPGERFLSCQATGYVAQIAAENQCPEVLYGAFLQKEPESPPVAATFPLRLLKQGVAPTSLHAHWFLRSALLAIDGFNPNYTRRPSFDALCALLQNGARAVYTRRVLIDCERHRPTPAETAGFALETYKVLYRRFGLWPALRWVFVQDRALLARRLWKWLKDAFLGSD